MNIKLFWKEFCPKCPSAKALVSGFDGVELLNVEEAEGMAEAVFYGVTAAPSILVIDDSGREVASWRGTVPTRDELDKVFGYAGN